MSKKYQKIPMTHLHLHSTYSELDAISKIPDIVKRAKEYGHSHISLTDHGTVAGCPEFYNECHKQGIKPILACEFYMVPDPAKSKEEKSRLNHHLILLAMNQEGWTNIKKLTTRANEQFYYAPRIGYEDLKNYSNGLICLTACLKGVVPWHIAAEKYEDAEKHLIILKGIFGDRFYLELQDGGLDVQIRVNDVMRRMAQKHELPVVGCQDAHYVDRNDVEAHEGIWAIRTRNTFDDPVGYGPRDDVEGQRTRPYYSTKEYWLKDAHHMLNEDLTTENGEKRRSTLTQKEIEESAKIAERIGDVVIEKRMHLPKYAFIPDISQVGCAVDDCGVDDIPSSHYHPGDIKSGETVDLASFNYLCELIARGYERVYERSWLNRTEEHRKRLAKELGDIKDAKLADYFLIVWDVVSWAKSQDIPVGPGRGCLTSDSYVSTLDGYKSIMDVRPNVDKVFNSTGDIVSVINKSSFDINEEVVSIKSYFDFWSTCRFTKDHKVLIKVGDEQTVYGKSLHPSNKKNTWVAAEDVQVGDFVCIPKVKKNFLQEQTISFWDFGVPEHCSEDGDQLIEKMRVNSPYDFSIRDVNKATGIARSTLHRVIDEGVERCPDSTVSTLTSYLIDSGFDSLDLWISYIRKNMWNYSRISRRLPIDMDFAKFAGLWIGDGCFKSDTGLSIFLGTSDVDAISFLKTYLSTIGVRFSVRDTSKEMVAVDIHSKLFNSMFKQIFGNCTSHTKFIPDSFMHSENLLKGLLVGLIWSDGSLSGGRISFDTTSEALMNNIRLLGYLLDTPSSVSKRVYDGNEVDSYKIRFAKTSVICELFGLKQTRQNYFFEDDKYLYCAVREKSIEEFSGKVYDLAVSGDSPSFLTGGYIVHNSASGSMVSFCLGITDVDPLKYGLIWERFYNAGRKGSLADIDIDIGKKDRERVIAYVKERFGEDRVAPIITFNTLKSKAALKDTAKLLGKQGGMAFDDANVMTRFVPMKHGQPAKIADALEENEKLAEYAERYPRLFNVAQKLEGCPKSRGTHAAGILISDKPFSEGFPLRWNTKEKHLMTEWDMETIDSLGYLKLDLLSLKTLDVLSDIEDEVNET